MYPRGLKRPSPFYRHEEVIVYEEPTRAGIKGDNVGNRMLQVSIVPWPSGSDTTVCICVGNGLE